MGKLGWFMSGINRNIPTTWSWARGDNILSKIFSPAKKKVSLWPVGRGAGLWTRRRGFASWLRQGRKIFSSAAIAVVVVVAAVFVFCFLFVCLFDCLFVCLFVFFLFCFFCQWLLVMVSLLQVLLLSSPVHEFSFVSMSVCMYVPTWPCMRQSNSP